MNARTKHRIMGGLVLLAVAAIFLPLAFHGSRDSSEITVSAHIPKLPPEPQVSLELGTPEKTLAAKSVAVAEPVTPSVKVAVIAKEAKVEPNPVTVSAAKVTNIESQSATVAYAKTTPTAQNQLSTRAQTATAKPATPPESVASQDAPQALPAKKLNSQPEPVQVASGSAKAFKMTVTPPDAWALQLASFSNKVNANHLVDQLRQSGIDSYTRTIQVNGKKIIRVFVGPEIQKTRLVKTERRLEKQFGLHGVIRKYEV